jgi:hypothetical protein
MLVDQMSVTQMYVVQMSVTQMYVVQMSVSQTSRNPKSRNLLKQKTF